MAEAKSDAKGYLDSLLRKMQPMNPPEADFFIGGGEMGRVIRGYDWAASPLGPPIAWPQPLRTLVSMMLSAEQPMFIAWGRERILLYNDAYAPMLGHKHGNALGRPFFDVWPEIQDELIPLFDRVSAGQPVHMADISLVLERRGYPEEAHFAFSYTPVRDEHGQVAGLFCACTETTLQVLADRRQAFLLAFGDTIRALSEPRAIMTAAVKALGRYLGANRVGYGEVQPDGETILLETSYVDGVAPLVGRFPLLGFGAQNIMRQQQGRTIACDDVTTDPSNNPEIWSAIDTRSFVSVPLVRDGQLRASLYVNQREVRSWPLDQVTLIEDIAARTWDAVERARSEEALREANETLEQRVQERTRERERAWRLSQDLLVIADTDGVLLAVNGAWTALLGWEEHDLIGSSFVTYTHPDDLEATLAAFAGILEAPLTRSYEYRLRHKDGTYRWFAWTGAFEDGNVYANGRHTSSEHEQAEALRMAEEQLRQAQKMQAIGQLTGGLAHDFNNLLTGIAGSLELLQARMSQGRVNDLERYIAAAQGASKRAAAITHRLLAFSRQQTLDPRPTDSNRLILGMEELIRRTVGPAIAVETVLAAGLWPTLCDPNQLENALLNLCINARDAMPDGGRLTIETANMWLDERGARERDLTPGQYVALCVTDTGTGMTPDVITRAFDPFFTTKPIGMGTGLGLSMIYGFVRQSGGQARIYSELGTGTTVRLYLPRHRGAAEDGELDVDMVPAPRAEAGETVLVVDDEPTVRMLVTDVLEEMGYAAIEAADGMAGVQVLQSDVRIDLLVTDVGLPGGMNGRQVADAARAVRPNLKVLFITGYAENAVVSNGHLDPGMHVLTKPFAMEVLANRIKDLITGA